MKHSELKPRQWVYDTIAPWVPGVVTKVLKTRVHINYGGKNTVYDIPHLQFLRKLK